MGQKYISIVKFIQRHNQNRQIPKIKEEKQKMLEATLNENYNKNKK